MKSRTTYFLVSMFAALASIAMLILAKKDENTFNYICHIVAALIWAFNAGLWFYKGYKN